LTIREQIILRSARLADGQTTASRMLPSGNRRRSDFSRQKLLNSSAWKRHTDLKVHSQVETLTNMPHKLIKSQPLPLYEASCCHGDIQQQTKLVPKQATAVSKTSANSLIKAVIW